MKQNEFYRQMLRIRQTEETIAARYSEWKMRCPTHLSVGQEAVAVGVCSQLDKEDLVVSSHRAHAHYLAKGGNLMRLIAELYGKETGCARGKGGSMHLIDRSAGFMGSTAIVANSIPVGVGLGLAAQVRKSAQVVAVFLGDGAVEEGAFYEAANFAALRRLPILFVCENNFYSVYSHLKNRQPEGREIYRLVEGIGIPATKLDGNDVEQVAAVTAERIATIREGQGPQFLECTTYRWREHCGPNYDNDIGYRTEAEFAAWKARDPVELHKQKLLLLGMLRKEDIRAMEEEISREIGAAFAFAEASPFPASSAAFTELFATQENFREQRNALF